MNFSNESVQPGLARLPRVDPLRELELLQNLVFLIDTRSDSPKEIRQYGGSSRNGYYFRRRLTIHSS